MSDSNASNINFRRFFDSSQDLLGVVNTQGHITYLNSMWTDLLGHPCDELLGEGYQRFIHPDDVKSTYAIFTRLPETQKNTGYAMRFADIHGEFKWIEWSTIFDDQQQLIYCTGRDVTQQIRAHHSLKVLEEITGVGVWTVDHTTNTPFWSEQTHKIHETDSKTFVPDMDTAVNFYAPDAIPILNEYLEKMASGEKVRFELPLITATGKRIWVESNAFAEIRDNKVIETYGTFEDITLKREQRIANEKLNERIDLAMKTSNIGVWEFDVETERLTWDDQMFSIYDVDKEGFKYSFQDWADTVVEEDREKASRGFAEALKSDDVFANQFRIRTRDNEIKYISAIGKVIRDSQSGSTYVTGVNWDITEQEKAKQALIIARDQAQQADVAKSTFLASMSHEIRTPLNGIFGALQLLQTAPKDAQQAKLVDTALSATKGLNRIINDILDFSKIQANKMTLEFLPVDIETLVHDVIYEQSLMTRHSNVKTHVTIAPNAKGYWLADPVRLKQILNNLISNAFKFTLEGGVNVDITLATLGYRIVISDTGIGMSESEVKYLFDPFTQADGSTTRKFGGTGLGLSITENLIRLFDGTITVKSAPNQGSSFTMEFPFEKAGEQAYSDAPQPSIELPDLSGKTVFVAEDNEINQTLISEMLKTSGVKYVMFSNGQTLIEGIKRKRPDLILCDIQMPVLDGLEACKIIRQRDTTVPIIAFTANVMNADTSKYLQNGFDDILAKPLLLNDLNHMLANYLAGDQA